jgi:L-arginine dehydrogenase
MVPAAGNGWSRENIRGDLGELACRKAQPPAVDKPSFFRSLGLGIEDVKMALEIYRLKSQTS